MKHVSDDSPPVELTRRDAIAALAGSALAGSALLSQELLDQSTTTLSDRHEDVLLALAEVLYPSRVETNASFIETYVVGRYELSDEHISGLTGALATVSATSRRETGRAITDLDPDQRDAVLRATGAHRARPDPEGTEAQRVRYYVVNELLYALYRTPTGGRLVGNPNPDGYPGGTDAYQRSTGDN